MNESEGYTIIIQRLDEFIRKYYKNLLIRGAIYSVALLLAFYISVSVLEYYAEFNTTLRTLIFYCFIIGAGYIITRFIAIPLLKLYRYGDVISYEQAAEIIGAHFNNVQDRLLNVLQLRTLHDPMVSTDLLSAGINQKIAELKPVPFASVIDLSQNKRYLKFVVPPVILIILLLIIAPHILSEGTTRLIHHQTYFEKQAPFRFSIKNKELKAVQQQDYLVELELQGNEVPAEVYISIRGNEYRLDKKDLSHFEFLIKNVQEDLSFHFNAGGFQSQTYLLDVLAKPTLLDFSMELVYPAYLKRAKETINNSGDVMVPQGTQINWVFRTKNSNSLLLRIGGQAHLLSPTSNGVFSYSTKFLNSAGYCISPGNKEISGVDSVNYAINVIPDAFPSIDLTEKRDSVKPGAIYFSGMIRDDYGFRSLRFFYKKYSTDSSGKSSEFAQEKYLNINSELITQPYVHFVDFTALGLKPGDKIEYYFEVSDNDGVNGSKSSKTGIGVFKAPTLEELEKMAGQKNKEIKEDLEASLKKARELQKELNELNRKVLEKKQLGWEEKKKMENLLDKQMQLQKQIEQSRQENQLNNQQQNEFKQQNESILEKQKELEKLFENIMTPEMKKLFEELQKMMDKMDKNKIQDALEKMNLSNKDIEKELDRTLEQFKKWEAEQKMEQLANKLEQLSKEQEKLANETEQKNSTKEELLQKQDDLNKKFDELKQDAKELKELNNKLENQLAIPDTKEKEQKVSEEQKNASDKLQKNNKKDASKSQKNAAQQMKEMSNQMQDAMEQMAREQEGEDMAALRQIMENLLNVSFAQEDLIKQTQKTKTSDPTYVKLGQKQRKLIDDSKIIEDSLLALSKRNPKVSATINREIAAIKLNMEKSLDALEDRLTGEAQTREQMSMTAINNLALLLNESMEQMQAEAKSKKNSSGSGGACKKPGQGQKPSMSSMRQMQESLNKQMEQMKKMLEQGKQPNGKKPGENKGQGGYGNIPGMSENLAKMAAEQEAIRRAVQEQLQKMKKAGQNPGGDLLEKMEETETDLVNKTITQETLKRQQDILTRLLEHEKAEREQDEEEKRKSNEARNYEPSNPHLLDEYKRLKEKELELFRTMPPALNPYYRTKVANYFNAVEK